MSRAILPYKGKTRDVIVLEHVNFVLFAIIKQSKRGENCVLNNRNITVLPLYGSIARDIAAGARRRNYVCIYRREQKVTAMGSEASSPANASRYM